MAVLLREFGRLMLLGGISLGAQTAWAQSAAESAIKPTDTALTEINPPVSAFFIRS